MQDFKINPEMNIRQALIELYYIIEDIDNILHSEIMPNDISLTSYLKKKTLQRHNIIKIIGVNDGKFNKIN